MRKFSVLLTVSLLLLTSCSYNGAESKETAIVDSNDRNESAKDKEMILEDQLTVDEYGIEFIIKNYLNLTPKEMDHFKDSLRKATLYLGEHFNPLIGDEKKFYITLNKGNKVSYVNGNSIHYYRYLEGRAPIIHELSHALFGYTPGSGYFTQEGIAIFIQNEYKEYLFPNEKTPIHQLMNYFVKNERYIPLEILMNEELAERFTDVYGNEALSWVSYVEAGSFTTYLIDKYGKEKYFLIYNQANLAAKIEQVYKKPLNELEKEWLAFINENELKERNQWILNQPYYKELNRTLLEMDFANKLKEISNR
ncbi:hypothetical protein EDD69_101336 [Thermolongibacillus altinsuensis]|uniref:Uncharacterized protein n=1 Tax=Thermolongibacillus altinsuensis TaxID=575256 RepID=A0A4R1QJN4_9BACL|nr:hypothetical protein [Thermolongibacillus altinsuensis]TCL53327.1 hypothetical protein EDD69_101336 [Thermolongibacillus altinsuensis]